MYGLPYSLLPYNTPEIVVVVVPPPVIQSSGKYPSQWVKDYEKLKAAIIKEQQAIKEAAAVLSRLGGIARARALNAQQRTAIASLAARTRWK
jgi:hypothetical protein